MGLGSYVGADPEGVLDSLNINLQATRSYSKPLIERWQDEGHVGVEKREMWGQALLGAGGEGGAWTKAVAVGTKGRSTSWNRSGGQVLSLGPLVIG